MFIDQVRNGIFGGMKIEEQAFFLDHITSSLFLSYPSFFFFYIYIYNINIYIYILQRDKL